MYHRHIVRDHFALLDRPVWTALTTEQSHLASRMGSACAFPEEIGPLAAAASQAHGDMRDFNALIWHRSMPLITLETPSPICSEFLLAENPLAVLQMLATSLIQTPSTHEIEMLGPEDSEQIFDLALRTKPGPFARKTNLLGEFMGVRREGQLIAMAGQRLRLPGFVEISAVCVDAPYRGQGIGAALVRQMADRILSSGDTPFLHTYASNTQAISLYQQLGFEIRASLEATVWARNAMVQDP
ncbi:MAG: GNAT family N-acetyltransferase [Pseudomonadota bacterium]